MRFSFLRQFNLKFHFAPSQKINLSLFFFIQDLFWAKIETEAGTRKKVLKPEEVLLKKVLPKSSTAENLRIKSPTKRSPTVKKSGQQNVKIETTYAVRCR